MQEARREEAWSVDFAEGWYNLITPHLGGHTTINQLRVLTEIAKNEIRKNPLGISHIARSLNIAQTTVFRIVHLYISEGVLREEEHPIDRRRRFIRHTAQSREGLTAWAIQARRLHQEMEERHFQK